MRNKKMTMWLRFADSVILILVCLWAMKIGFPPDIRRAWLVVFGSCYCFWPEAKRGLIVSRLFRNLLCTLVCNKKLRQKCFLGLVIFFVGSGILTSLSVQYSLWDVGIYQQLLWNLSKGNGYLSVLSGASLFLRDHFVWSLFLFIPFYWLTFGNPWLLGILPGLLVGGMLALILTAWYVFAANLSKPSSRRSAWVCSVFLIGAWAFQTFWGNLFWGFHADLLGSTLLSWALVIYLISAKNRVESNWKVFFIVLLLLIFATGGKETYFLTVALTGFALLVIEPSKLKKLILLGLSIACVSAFLWYSQSDRDPGKNYFVRCFGYLGTDLPSLLKTLILHPIYVFKNIPWKLNFEYWLNLMIPFGFVPAVLVINSMRDYYWGKNRIARKTPHSLPPRAWWILLGGGSSFFYTSISSSNSSLRDPNAHYILEVIPFLGTAMVMAFFRLPARKLFRWGMVWLFLCWTSLWREPWRDIRPNINLFKDRIPLLKGLNQIPDDRIVMAEDPAGVWVSARKKEVVWMEPHGLEALGNQCPDTFIFNASPHDTQLLKEKLADIDRVRKPCDGIHSLSPKKIANFGDFCIYSTSRP